MPRAGHTHTGRALCAVVAEHSSITEKLQNLAKPQPSQTTCIALPQQHPVQAPPLLLHTAEAAIDLAVPNGILRADHTLTGRALYAVVAGHSPNH